MAAALAVMVFGPAASGAAAGPAGRPVVLSTIDVAATGAPAVDPILGKIYIPTGHSLVVASETTSKVTGSIPLGAGTGGTVAVDASTGTAYVTGPDKVLAVNLASGKVIASIPVAATPNDLAVDQFTHMVFVAVSNGFSPPSEAEMISEATHKVTAVIPRFGLVSLAAVDPVAGRAFIAGCFDYMCDPGQGVIMNAATGRAIGGLDVPPYPGGMSADPANRTLYVSLSGGSVSAIDEATGHETGEIAADGSSLSVAADPAAGIVYVTLEGDTFTSDGTVAAFSTRTGALIATWPVGADPAYVTADPLTHRIYVVNSGSGTVTVISGVPPHACCPRPVLPRGHRSVPRAFM